MRFVKFATNGPDGEKTVIVNLDHVRSASPDEGLNTVSLRDAQGGFICSVDKDQFIKATDRKDDTADRLCAAVNRLVTSLDRLAAHIPSSVRMHL